MTNTYIIVAMCSIKMFNIYDRSTFFFFNLISVLLHVSSYLRFPHTTIVLRVYHRLRKAALHETLSKWLSPFNLSVPNHTTTRPDVQRHNIYIHIYLIGVRPLGRSATPIPTRNWN